MLYSQNNSSFKANCLPLKSKCWWNFLPFWLTCVHFLFLSMLINLFISFKKTNKENETLYSTNVWYHQSNRLMSIQSPDVNSKSNVWCHRTVYPCIHYIKQRAFSSIQVYHLRNFSYIWFSQVVALWILLITLPFTPNRRIILYFKATDTFTRWLGHFIRERRMIHYGATQWPSKWKRSRLGLQAPSCC